MVSEPFHKVDPPSEEILTGAWPRQKGE